MKMNFEDKMYYLEYIGKIEIMFKVDMYNKLMIFRKRTYLKFDDNRNYFKK